MLRVLFFISVILVSFSSCNINSKKHDKESQNTEVKNEDNDSIKSTENNYESGMTSDQIKTAKGILADVKNDYKKVDAASIYKTYCTLCHGRKGKLNLNNAKDLSLSEANLEERVAQIYHGAGVMTPYKGIISDQEIVALAYFIEQFRE